MATTARTRKPAVQTTITKTEARKLVKAGELGPNKFRRPCILCGQIVPAGEGVLGGSKTEGWWASHMDGKCVGVAKKTASRTPRKNDEFDLMVEAVKDESASKKKVANNNASEEESADMVDAPKVPVRKRNNTMAAAKKTVTRRTATRAKVTPTETPKPTVKRTPRKAAPTKPAPVIEETESASEESDTPQQLVDLVNSLKGMIEAGTLDEVLGDIDDAISARLDAVTPKKTTARKTTTTAPSKAEKLAPVTRKPATESASPSAKPVPVRPRKGFDYQVNPTLKNAMAGVKVKFKSYVADTNNAKSSCELLEEFKGKPAGTRVTVPTRYLVKIDD
ncbi:hypothetical protein [Streptomyces sp. NPDC006477]|uniref:hypothetical protein n=1 Tax=Streptomyces sp. NPDC006477 TaxID=3364747 RepID=UPI00367402E1